MGCVVPVIVLGPATQPTATDLQHHIHIIYICSTMSFDWISKFKDSRGLLVAFNFPDLPFTPRRVFVVSETPENILRGKHAHYVTGINRLYGRHAHRYVHISMLLLLCMRMMLYN